ncbi:RNA polymerase sigma factor [Clostridiisalibacter paucivorans]|uniref:RNA polymerase sigma factor n=1 Tax=Clostridiisalibacter paucivorans TaxID=408753 RepID=UPI00047A44E6|nr:sigma-70 family RNA polymerase sigma factor [Clostridiisalibacter paucivorans]
MYEEINELVIKSKLGDIDAKGKLILRLKPLILSSIRRYFNDTKQYDDLIQGGFEVVLRCINEYSSHRQTEFLGYVKTMLRYHYLDKHKTKKIAISLNQTISTDEQIEIIDTLKDDIPSIDHILIRNQELVVLNRAISELTKRQKEIIEMFYIDGITMVEIAERLGISYRTVVNTKKVAIKKLQSIVNI